MYEFVLSKLYDPNTTRLARGERGHTDNCLLTYLAYKHSQDSKDLKGKRERKKKYSKNVVFILASVVTW